MGNRCVWLGGELEDVDRSFGVCDLEHRLDRHTQNQDWTRQKHNLRRKHTQQHTYAVHIHIRKVMISECFAFGLSYSP